MMRFCGNVIELVDESKVKDDKDFILMENTNIKKKLKNKTMNINIYVEKTILRELLGNSEHLIDVAIGNVNETEVGFLFFKKSANVYG